MSNTLKFLSAAAVAAASITGPAVAQSDTPEMMDTANGSCLVGNPDGDVKLYRMSCEEYLATGAGNTTPDEVSSSNQIPEETAESLAD
jgi:hypothetical protein